MADDTNATKLSGLIAIFWGVSLTEIVLRIEPALASITVTVLLSGLMTHTDKLLGAIANSVIPAVRVIVFSIVFVDASRCVTIPPDVSTIQRATLSGLIAIPQGVAPTEIGSTP